MSGKLVLVTGVTGFIAGHVANQLLDAGYRVRGTARRNKLETLRETVKITGLEFVQVDDVATTDFTEALEDSCFSPVVPSDSCIFDSDALPKVINIIAAHSQLTSIYVSGSISLRHKTGYSLRCWDSRARHQRPSRPSRGSIIAIERISRAVDVNPFAVWVRGGAISLLRSLSVPYLVPNPKKKPTLETLELFGCNMTPILEYMNGKWFPFDLTHLTRLVVFCLDEGDVSDVRELIRFPSVKYFVILPPTSRVINMNWVGYHWHVMYRKQVKRPL
ncbi:hypothetical protein H0H93_014920 [Arthromyces matolae]|nr:hypothetical protein H0H93_014920 [Arthromyces matolae]